MLASSLPTRRQQYYQSPHTQSLTIPQNQQQIWSSSTTTIHTPQPQPHYITTTNSPFSFGTDQPLFDFQPHEYNSNRQSLMQTDHNSSWLSNGQLTPTSSTRAHHHRESSLSSLGSAGPASPYTANTSNPQVAGDLYNEFQDFQHPSSKPLTPAHTPSQEHFLTPQYSNFYHSSNLAYTMGGHDGLPKQTGNAELMPAPEFTHSGRPSIASVASRDSPATPPSYEEERQKNGETSRFEIWLNEYLHLCDNEVYRSTMPKLDRTMTDVYADELYNPSFHITSAPPTSTPAPTMVLSPQNDVFSQRLQAANSQHLSASNTQTPLMIPSRERSPFRHGSPLAPTGNSFGPQSPNVRFGTATHMREQQKAENDARALQKQLERTSPEQTTPKTISPKDVDLVYHESEEDANTPLFPPQQNQRQPSNYHQQSAISQEPSESDDNVSHQSYGSMATSRRESSSAYSTSSHATQQQSGNFNFAPPAVPGSVRQIPQQYPFVPQSRRQHSNLSNVSEDFTPTLTSMESSSSEYAPEASEVKKPAGASADTGTYTCTYHGCTLRFDTPAKLQRHKREGHRSSASVGDEGGMTSAARLNSQAGPHKVSLFLFLSLSLPILNRTNANILSNQCERINPSTGKPCNTIFSRPYDLTRHEDTIHNARKQKVHCPLCTEEKTFSRNDALTRHLRVVHPEHVDLSKSRRRGGHD
jgi:26S proteasome regulatory subunit N4